MKIENIVKRKKCAGCRTKLALTPNGDIYPCVFLKYEEFYLGNILNEDLLEIWNNEKAERFRVMSNLECCDKCSESYCSGGCIGLIFLETHEFSGVDPRCPRSLYE